MGLRVMMKIAVLWSDERKEETIIRKLLVDYVAVGVFHCFREGKGLVTDVSREFGPCV